MLPFSRMPSHTQNLLHSREKYFLINNAGWLFCDTDEWRLKTVVSRSQTNIQCAMESPNEIWVVVVNDIVFLADRDRYERYRFDSIHVAGISAPKPRRVVPPSREFFVFLVPVRLGCYSWSKYFAESVDQAHRLALDFRATAPNTFEMCPYEQSLAMTNHHRQ